MAGTTGSARADVEARVKKIIASELVGVSPAMVQSNSRISELRSKSDEWALVGVVLALELEFGLRIDENDLDRLLTVSDFVDYICGIRPTS